MSNSELQYELRYLVNLSLEGDISDEQCQRLDELLSLGQEAIDYYLELIQVHYAMESSDWRIEYNHRFSSINGLLMGLAEEEKTAPAVEIPEVQPPLVEKVV